MKISRIQKFFLAWIGLMLLFLWLSTPEVYPLKSDEVSFHMTEQDELFFKNLRLADYHVMLDSASQFKIHQYKAWPEGAYFPEIQIIQNWLNDEAYVFFDIEEDMQHIVTGADTHSVQLMSSIEQYQLAQGIYDAIAEKEPVVLLTGLSSHTLEKEELKKTKRVLKDYFRLVGQLR